MFLKIVEIIITTFAFFSSWQVKKINLGHPEEIFHIILEIGSSPPGQSYVAIDNIALEHCFPGKMNHVYCILLPLITDFVRM